MARWRTPTHAEQALWGAAMRDVRPLDPREIFSVSPPPPAPLPAPEAAAPAGRPAQPARRPSGGVDRATVDRLKRGQVGIEARIDLHGLDQRAAFASLMGFIETSSRAGRRALLVITGKGAVGDGGGVLRRQVPAWLTASPLAVSILTIQPAHARHGGDGAFYVLLRRKKHPSGF